MSKSKNNGIDPQALIDRYGADTARLFTMFASPPEDTLEWSDEGVAGAHRFLKRLWELGNKPEYRLPEFDDPEKRLRFLQKFDWDSLTGEQKKTRQLVHSLLEQANRDFGKHQFNTVVAAAMKMVNSIYQIPRFDAGNMSQRGFAAITIEAVDILVRMLSPIVPHIAHVLWTKVGAGQAEAVIDARWPQPDPKALVRDIIEYVVQVNGKVRSRITVPAGSGETETVATALADATVQRFLAGKEIKKKIVVPGKLVNIVVI